MPAVSETIQTAKQLKAKPLSDKAGRHKNDLIVTREDKSVKARHGRDKA